MPTKLGVQLISGLRLIDNELVAPTLRSDMERSLELVAQGKKSKSLMVREQLERYANKFSYFKANINILDELFGSHFHLLKQAGKPFIQCPQCNRYTKLISLIPQRIYCQTCDRIYQVPQTRKMIETSTSCAYCGMHAVTACGEKCTQHRTVFCPKCYTDGEPLLTRDIESYCGKQYQKGITC